MTTIMRGSGLVAAAITGSALVLLCGCSTGPNPPVTASQATQYFAEVAAAAEHAYDSPAGWDGFCGNFSDDLSMCESSLTATPSGKFAPTLLRNVSANSQQTVSGSRIITITARVADNHAFQSQIELIRTDSGQLKAVDPVYWTPRKIQ